MTYSPTPRTAVQLTAQARAAAQVASTGFGLALYLPDNPNYSLSFNFNVNQVALNDAASYRSFNTEADFGRTGGSESRSGKLPPISRKYRVDELEQLTLYGQADAIAALLEKHARALGASIAARLEFARGEAIEKGIVTIDERGLQFTIDYGRKASHTIVAGTAFSAAGATPVDTLDVAKAIYQDTNGTAPGVTLISPEVLANLQKNADLMKMALGRGSDLPSRISVDDVLSTLASFGYGNVRVFDEAIGGQRVINARKVLFLPATGGVMLDGGPLGTTDWGIPAEAINDDYGIPTSDRPGIFAGSFTQEDPEGTNVLASAIALPVVTNADASMSIQV